jgi:hypothetical protein
VNSMEETVKLARRVSGMVKEYMAVQDDLFKPSIRKVLRIPGIYRPADYGKNKKILEDLLAGLSEVKSAIRRDASDSSPAEAKFLGNLRGYVSLMTAATEKLAHICGRLGERSGGGDYGKDEYVQDMSELRAVQKEHLEAGVKLHEMMKELSAGG